MFTVHLVAHTHWDREWYQTQVRFRQRLVALVDELLDDPPPQPASFLLDGQAIVVEDYLAVRPERAAELSSLLQRGSLEAGPWYVLADELIPGAEALVRNLLVGRRVLRALRADPPPVLYCPDSFGHPATLPMLAAGFGFPLIVLWRGFGGARWPDGDVVRWRAADGATVLVFHLPQDGYEFGSQLPSADDDARARWRLLRDVLGGRSRTGVLLVQNGADHHARQRRQRDAIAALARAAAATGDELRESSLSAFASSVLARAAAAELPVIEGELRDSYGYTWTLQGTLASRAAQKRRNAHAERALVRDAEPWAAFATRHAGPSRVPLLVAAWRSLLQAHPHDTLCGCSIDAVAAAMDRRLDDALAQARGVRDDAIADLVDHDSASARAVRERWRPAVIVRNRAPRPRGGVAIVAIKQFLADVPVGPGSAMTAPPRDVATIAEPALAGGIMLQVLGRETRHDRIESPRHYPDNDLVAVTHAALWLDAVPAYGMSTVPIATPDAQMHSSKPRDVVRAEPHTLDNGVIRVSVDGAGNVLLEQKATARRISALLAIEDRVDRGDLYTPSIGEPASVVEFVDARVTHSGPLVGELTLRWRLVRAGAGRQRGRPRALVAVRLRLEAGAPFLRLRVEGRNRADDHRLRLAIATDVGDGEVWADAAFGPVRRAPIVVSPAERRIEAPLPTAPLHRYVSLFSEARGATLYSDGLAEYEATPNGQLFITLVRAVGELSRNDIPERPGHAGWPSPTPRAQSRGPFTANLALLVHGGRTAGMIDSIERVADDVLLPLHGTTYRDAVDIRASTFGAELRGAGLAFSALKESERGDAVVARALNLLGEEVEGSWHFGFPVREAYLARLDETILGPLPAHDDVVMFRAPPHAVVTLLVR